ncbi:hypothetical protein TIFTF001_015783 [Ficus carica]|uniref:Peptidase A1 domain-containing protein n=1 Tax=Ficus carica TaxID=3494 RepID=A0AA88D870_FICCA|nr:hypothetical protein TIFTF001_015783 [Ficus carica]
METVSKSPVFSILLIFLVVLSSNIVAAQDQPPPKAFHIPIAKDTDTLQYYASFQIGTPPTNINAVIDVGGQFLSAACDKYNSSTTRRSIPCGSTECKALTTTKCGSNHTCSLPSFSPFNKDSAALAGGLNNDVVTVYWTDGTSALPNTYSTHITFSCVDSSGLLEGMAAGTNGILGLGRNTSPQMSLPTKLSSVYNIPPKFSLCIPSSDDYGFGDLFIGGGPYRFPGGNDASEWLLYTPLAQSPETGEYFVSVKSIKIDKSAVHFDTSLLDFNQKGVGGTKISTATPYGVLHSSIYKAVVGDFAKRAAARNITRVASVAPFGTCFSTANVHWTKAGPRVPVIDLELPGNMVSLNWRIHGANSMVRVKKDVMCLGFVDGGSKARASIVLGGHQLEDNFLDFDLTRSLLGFSSSLLPRDQTCSHFRNL